VSLKPTQTSGYPMVSDGLSQKQNPYIGSMGLLSVEGFHLDESGSLTKWNGFQQYQTTASLFNHAGETTPDVTGLFLFTKADGTRFEMATTKTKVWRFGTPVANEYNELALNADVGGQRTGVVDDIYSFAVLRDILYMFNGVDSNLKYDGTNIRNMGIAQPATAPTAASGGAGVLTGGYSYKVTFYNSAKGHESNPSAASNTFTASSNSIDLTGIPVSTDLQVDKRRLYRTTTGGGVWLFLADINDNTTTIYADNASDATLGIKVELLANGEPPVAKIAEVYKGRVFMVPANSSRIHFSDQEKPNAVHPNDFRDLDPDDGDNIRGLKRLFGQLVAFKDDSIWNGSGTDRFNFSFNRQVTGVGAVNNDSILTVPGRNVFMFMSEDGFYSYDGVSERYESYAIEKVVKGLNQSRVRQIQGFVYKKLNIMVWIASNGSSTTNNLMIVYDYVQNMWTTRDLTKPKMAANVASIIEDSNNNEIFYTGGYGTGEVFKGDTGGSDGGAAISCSVTDRALPRTDKHPYSQKSFDRLILFFKPVAGSSVTVSYAINSPNSSFLSLGTLNTSDSSGQATIRFNGRGRRIFFKFTNSAVGQDVVIRGWSCEYKTIGRIS